MDGRSPGFGGKDHSSLEGQLGVADLPSPLGGVDQRM